MPAYQLQDLLYLMQRLRDPADGCPWDIKQDWASILPSTIEEAYEVADAIERGDFDAVREELGDLLFQVVFYAQLGSEQGRFDFYRIQSDLVDKLVRRHPHVFPDGSLSSRRPQGKPAEADIKANWEKTKEVERAAKGQFDLFADVPLNLPALSRAQKLQKRAARVGFDWPDIGGVLDKIDEELGELREELDSGDREAQEHELGDLLFATVNLARHLGLDAESALRRCGLRFEQRIAVMEEDLGNRGGSIEEAGPEELEAAWVKAKDRLSSVES